MNEILFFRSPDVPAGGDDPAHTLHGTVETWVPGVFAVKPAGLPWLPFGVWWLFHQLRVFRNRGYRVFLIRDDGQVVHRSCVFPPFFRFPFMADRDLQVGDIWTSADHRSRGLAAAALKCIVAASHGTTLWFLCDSRNQASARLARSAGLTLYAVGAREPRWGLGVLGQFVIRSRVG